MIYSINMLQARYLSTLSRLSYSEIHEKQKALQKSIDLSMIKLKFSKIPYNIPPTIKGTEAIPQPIYTNHPA
jgi:hypothetical protein